MDWKNSLNAFESISLNELDATNFSDREDTKSVFQSILLSQLIEKLLPLYNILDINGVRSFRYESFYLDTADLKFYNDHQRNKARRHKIRFRRYIDHGSSFFEIKTRNGKGRSSKTRISTNGHFLEMSPPLNEIVRVHADIDPTTLLPSLQVSVNRITLLHKNGSEKVTLDFDVEFLLNGKKKKLDSLVIAEVKQIKFTPDSDFFRIQRQLSIYPISISKYCVGVASLDEKVKANRFKSSLLKINKIIN